MGRKKANFDKAVAKAPSGMTRVVTYSSITGVKNDRYKFEKADAYLKAHFNAMDEESRKGYNAMRAKNLSVSERRIMEGWVLSKMVNQGLSKKNIVTDMQEEWGVDKAAANLMVNYVISTLVDVNEKDKERGRVVYLERLENMYRICMEQGDIKTALGVLEQLAKTRGYYNDTTVLSPVMNFKFGNEPNIIIPKQDVLPEEGEAEALPAEEDNPAAEDIPEIKFEI